jgi:hypothetical protein
MAASIDAKTADLRTLLWYRMPIGDAIALLPVRLSSTLNSPLCTLGLRGIEDGRDDNKPVC